MSTDYSTLVERAAVARAKRSQRIKRDILNYVRASQVPVSATQVARARGLKPIKKNGGVPTQTDMRYLREFEREGLIVNVSNHPRFPRFIAAGALPVASVSATTAPAVSPDNALQRAFESVVQQAVDAAIAPLQAENAELRAKLAKVQALLG